MVGERFGMSEDADDIFNCLENSCGGVVPAEITVSIAVICTACRVHHPVDDNTNVRIIFNASSSLFFMLTTGAGGRWDVNDGCAEKWRWLPQHWSGTVLLVLVACLSIIAL